MRILIYSALGAYSLVLVVVELSTSQDYVRQYFSDIEGPVRFYAINTIISGFLLWSVALMFLACLPTARATDADARLPLFCLLQILIFGYLGFDDIFKVHESIGRRLDIGDHFVLLTVGLVEVLALYWGRAFLSRVSGRYLAGAALLFGVMIVVDALFPHDMVLRLSIEDLAKTWSGLLFFLFAWSIFEGRVESLFSKTTVGV